MEFAVNQPVQGVLVRHDHAMHGQQMLADLLQQPELVWLGARLEVAHGKDAAGAYSALRIRPFALDALAPGFNTLHLHEKISSAGVPPGHAVAAEIYAALFMSPLLITWPSLAEMESAVRIRINIARAASATWLAFDTSDANRPHDYWRYDEDEGFLILPDASLTDALQAALHPPPGQPAFRFSCYRATEYVLLLAMALELRGCNPVLYAQLQAYWRCHQIKSARFHEVFLTETGSLEAPMPPMYYVPGDRVWFRNPDLPSSEVTGYEGSWVIYLGQGLFSNFWEPSAPYTFEAKCLEIYHWRDGLVGGGTPQAYIDEARVASEVARSGAQGQRRDAIVKKMRNYREPSGTYTEQGGCVDTSRECIRRVRPGSSDIHLPAPADGV